jgi:hypothetical protein
MTSTREPHLAFPIFLRKRQVADSESGQPKGGVSGKIGLPLAASIGGHSSPNNVTPPLSTRQLTPH